MARAERRCAASESATTSSVAKGRAIYVGSLLHLTIEDLKYVNLTHSHP